MKIERFRFEVIPFDQWGSVHGITKELRFIIEVDGKRYDFHQFCNLSDLSDNMSFVDYLFQKARKSFDSLFLPLPEDGFK